MKYIKYIFIFAGTLIMFGVNKWLGMPDTAALLGVIVGIACMLQGNINSVTG